MIENDQELLLSLVKEYSAKDMVSALATAFKDHADGISDLGLKEQAVEYAEASELLDELIDVIQ